MSNNFNMEVIYPVQLIVNICCWTNCLLLYGKETISIVYICTIKLCGKMYPTVAAPVFANLSPSPSTAGLSQPYYQYWTQPDWTDPTQTDTTQTDPTQTNPTRNSFKMHF